MTTKEKVTLLMMCSEWDTFAAKCNDVAARHRAKGERLQAIEQAAFATGRKSCADALAKFANAAETETETETK